MIITEAMIFSLGWLAKAILTSFVLELCIRPLVRFMIRRVNSEASPLTHYLLKHVGKSWNCQTCQT